MQSFNIKCFMAIRYAVFLALLDEGLSQDAAMMIREYFVAKYVAVGDGEAVGEFVRHALDEDGDDILRYYVYREYSPIETDDVML